MQHARLEVRSPNGTTLIGGGKVVISGGENMKCFGVVGASQR